MKTVLFVVVAIVAILLLDRVLLAAERRGWIYYRRSRGRSGSSASAFLEIQSMLEPSRKHVLEARSEEKEERDAEGDPPQPMARFAHIPDPMDDVLQQYTTEVEGGGGTFSARAIAVPRKDGTWEGYLEFVPLDGSKPFRTDRETSQPNRDAVAYWASGIEPVYLAGALERALRRR